MLSENYIIIPKIPLINKSPNFRSIKPQQNLIIRKRQGINTFYFQLYPPKQCEYLKEREGREENSLCDPMDCSLPGSSLHGILQARVLEWFAISFSSGSSQPRDWTQVSHIPGRHFNLWATREALFQVCTPLRQVSLFPEFYIPPYLI